MSVPVILKCKIGPALFGVEDISYVSEWVSGVGFRLEDFAEDLKGRHPAIPRYKRPSTTIVSYLRQSLSVSRGSVEGSSSPHQSEKL